MGIRERELNDTDKDSKEEMPPAREIFHVIKPRNKPQIVLYEGEQDRSDIIDL